MAVGTDPREGSFRRRSRRGGEFEFRVTLPGSLQDEDIEASLAHGVLNVYVPKAESTKSSKITVSESGDGSS
ncbi:Hsp20 family protein [Mycobacterium sp. JS623]|uniref:Hsp20 family protein n=1 Tax=Mycobacterium sp. JS623 TaxID=212767 RepID=UPI0002E29231|nr:Hsp20 family protein [Mycobacterium sp. JS623]